MLGPKKTSHNSRTNSAQNTNTKKDNFHNFPINQTMGGVVWSQKKKKGPLSFKIVVKASKWQNSCNSSIVHDKKSLQIILSTLLQFNFT